MSVRHHPFTVPEPSIQEFRGACSCGWRRSSTNMQRRHALRAARRHAGEAALAEPGPSHKEVPRQECRAARCDIGKAHPAHSRCSWDACLDQGLNHMTPHRVRPLAPRASLGAP